MSLSILKSTPPLLVLGSKNYSSWSLRPWLFLRKAGFEFREHVISFDAPDYQQQIAEFSPSGRVPVLIDSRVKISDSLAICEYAADTTGNGLPQARMARAVARSVAAEMHSGFAVLREGYPLNIRARRRVAATPALLKDVARIDEIWTSCLEDYGGTQGWLFDEFSLADAMYAPVVFRFQTYGAPLSAASNAYLAHALADPTYREWQDGALLDTCQLPAVDQIGTAS